MKKRIDRLMVERGLAESREKAQAMIMAGMSWSAISRPRKPARQFLKTLTIRLKEAPHPYVSRGGDKTSRRHSDIRSECVKTICLR